MLADVDVGLMFRVVKPLGALITTLAGRARVPGQHRRAELRAVLRDDYLVPHREAAWALLVERLREAATFA